MVWLGHFHRRLRHPLVLFGTTASVLLGTLAWLAWHTLEQDRALVDQRVQERLDRAADLVAGALEAKLSDVEGWLARNVSFAPFSTSSKFSPIYTSWETAVAPAVQDRFTHVSA